METEQFRSAFGNEKNYARPATQRTPRARESTQGTLLQENYTKTTNWPSAAREVAMPSAPLAVLDQKSVQGLLYLRGGFLVPTKVIPHTMASTAAKIDHGVLGVFGDSFFGEAPHTRPLEEQSVTSWL